MKLNRQDWILILVGIGILAFVWVSGGIREGFTQVPVITKSDVSASASNTSGSAALQQLTSWVNENAPNVKNIPSWANYFYMFGTQYSGINSPPSIDDFFNAYAKGWAASGETGVTGDQLKGYYLAGSDDMAGPIYSYYFGTPLPTPSNLSCYGASDGICKTCDDVKAAYNKKGWGFDPSKIAQCQSTKPSPMAAKTGTSPSPASSSSTQPMTVGIPSPCRSSYKSIPGGSMEFKCFS
jgi:hypothetical protein